MPTPADTRLLLKQLFQQEFSKIVAVISSRYGLAHVEIAEDLVSDTFLTATEHWSTHGLPPHPTAWLYTVAKQKTLAYFRREKIYTRKVAPTLTATAESATPSPEIDFSPQYIRDSQLKMLFAVCTPLIAGEAQIALALRVLCGFGIDEIASAFLTNKETINKRLVRAKAKLRAEGVRMELPSEAEVADRLDRVLHIIYLLFNEGYYSRTQDEVIRRELCWEAMRLAVFLTENELTNRPETQALLALMCFHASRFDARQTADGGIVLYGQQDENKWDTDLIAQGIHYLERSASGNVVSPYHLEARIAQLHCLPGDGPDKWESILQLHNHLLVLQYSPAAALNRTYALYRARGATEALPEARKLRLETNHFYWVLLAELLQHTDLPDAITCLKRALEHARTTPEQQLIRERIRQLAKRED